MGPCGVLVVEICASTVLLPSVFDNLIAMGYEYLVS
jgi:hypothetical protein